MSDLKANVIMPSSDYKAICDAVRAKTGSTELLKSGELAEAISGISGKSSIIDMSRFCTAGLRLDELSKIDTSRSTNFSGTFINCDGASNFPNIDTSSGINFTEMFYNCKTLTSPPNLDTGNGTDFSRMFYNCFKLTSVPDIDTSNGVYFGSMFYYCESLTSIPEIDTSNGTRFESMFYYCRNLVSIPSLDVNLVTSFQYFNNMFTACSKLKNLYLRNIRASIALSNNKSYGTLLTVDSLINTIKELCTVSSSQTLTMGSTNLAKISDLYCRVTDDTSEKKPMELCDSTAEGAMTLSAYAALKNWTLA